VAACVQADFNTQGVVQELVSRRPVGGVRITLDCRREHFFGSESVRIVETTSRPDGRFFFLPSDIRGCSYLRISQSKEGFRDAAKIPNSAIMIKFELSAAVPNYLYMVRESEVSELQLEGLFNQSNAVRVAPVGPMPEADYTAVNTRFFDSIRIASTPEEIRWVQERYCDRLSMLWSKIPVEEQRKHLGIRYANVVMYPDVLSYCQKTPGL
jgi:hypothetical protein